MNHRRAAAGLLTAVLVAAPLVSGCGQPAAAPGTAPGTGPAAGRPSVVATTDVYGAIATAVAGDKATVTSLIDSPDADPHEYESTPKDVVAVSAATVFVVNGGGYDDFAGKVESAAGDKATVIDVSELSGLKPATLRETEFNEHVWYHLPTMAKLADRLAAELGRADPADAGTFIGNAATFKAGLDGLGKKVAGIGAAHRGDRVAITEPVPGYLIAAAGLTNATPAEFSRAAEEGNDPPAAVLNETLDLFRGAAPVRALLANPQAENAATRQLADAARAAGIPVVTMTETLPAGDGDYLRWMGGQIDALGTALDRR